MVETTAHELLDVVDLDDQVLRTENRADIHRLKLPHRSVHVLVFSDNGSLLLQQRSMQKDECAGMWDSSCAGHVEAGQSYAETAVRELDEELGFTPARTLEFLFKMNPTPDNGMEFASVYHTIHSGPFKTADDEIDAIEWFPIGQVDEWVGVVDSGVTDDASTTSPKGELTSGFCEIWRRYRALDHKASDDRAQNHRARNDSAPNHSAQNHRARDN